MRLRSYYDLEYFFDYGVHLPSRTLYLPDITEGSVARFLKGMHLLPPGSSLTILLNSPGGDTYHGLAAYDAISTREDHVTIIAYGHVMSMGSVIFQAADRRVMSPTATQMIHLGGVSLDLPAKETYAAITDSKRLDALIADIYLNRIHETKPSFTRAAFRRIHETDSYFTAQQSVEMGLADEVLSPPHLA